MPLAITMVYTGSFTGTAWVMFPYTHTH